MPTTSPLDIPAIDLPAPGPRSARTILSSSAHVPPGRTRTLRVGLVGLGTVGQGLVGLLARKGPEILARHGVGFRFERVLVRDPAKVRATAPDEAELTADPEVFLSGTYDVVVEAAGGLEPVGGYVERLLRRGIPVVTANKALLAERGDVLAELAAASGASLRGEASVAAGIPLLGLLERALLTTTVTRVTGILNATSLVVLGGIARGATLEAALSEAQGRGFAEADASLDVSGLDAAQKLTVLVRALCGRTLPWTAIEVEGIERVRAVDAERARVVGGRLRPVACADLSPDRPRGWVAPAFVPDGHPLACVEGGGNGVLLEGDTLEDLFLAGPGAGALPTAASILDDLLAVARGEGAPLASRARAPGLASVAPGPCAPPVTGWFLSVDLSLRRDSASEALRALDLAGLRARSLREPPGSAPALVVETFPAPRSAIVSFERRARRAEALLDLRAYRTVEPRPARG